MQRPIGFIPGAGYDKFAYWPIQTCGRDNFLFFSYRKKEDQAVDPDDLEEQVGIRRYAKRIHRQLVEYGKPIDLVAHSLGFPIACRLMTRLYEDGEEDLVQNVIGLTPALVGGPPKRKFYWDPRYVGGRSNGRYLQTPTCIRDGERVIRGTYPDFDHRCTGQETNRALLQAVRGEIPAPTPEALPRHRLRIFYTRADNIIPAKEILRMSRREGFSVTRFQGCGAHSAPVADTDGRLLEKIKQQLARMG